MIVILILFLFSFQGNAKAEDLYLVEKTDGSVAIVNYLGGTQDSLQKVLKEFGFAGLPYKKINRSDLPLERSDRDLWKSDGVRVVVDQVKKQNQMDLKAAKEARKEAILEKLKISKQEFEDLKIEQVA